MIEDQSSNDKDHCPKLKPIVPPFPATGQGHSAILEATIGEEMPLGRKAANQKLLNCFPWARYDN